MMLKKTILHSLLIGLVLLASCATGDIPSVKTLPDYYEDAETADQITASYLGAYIIGPGDALAVDVWREAELSKQVTVRLDGKISLPLINDVQAADITCEELQAKIGEKYKDFIDVPEVSVTLLQSNSRKVYMVGKINGPGEYPLQKDLTFLQAISLAGGFNMWANTSDILLIRKIEGVERTFKIDYDAIVSGKDLSQNIRLLPDDTIFVP
jgi:polysaccharide export outer membrane protein